MDLGRLDTADVVIIVLYMLAIIAVGLWSICTGKGDLRNYFLAGRSQSWWPIGLSIFASNIGSNQFVGLAGTGAASGIAVILFEWNAGIMLILLGWIFLPVYVSAGIYTMPEYLQFRFGGRRLRTYLSIIVLLTYTFTSISADLYSGGIFINQTFGWPLYGAVAFIVVIALIFTVLGGLQTVIVTDAVSVIIMLIGGLALTGLGFARVGGLEALRYKYMRAVSDWTLDNLLNSTCGLPRKDAWHIFRDPVHADYPSVPVFLRTTIGASFYWCSNQVMVQRVLAAKNITHARGGALLAGLLKFLPLFLMVFPGMISRTLFPNEVACANAESCMEVCGSAVGCSNIAYPRLVVELLPAGLRGLLLAAMIAAVISTLTSFFNSSSSLFTLDIWSLMRPKASNTELVIVGRLFVLALTAVSIAWIPVMANAKGGEIYKYATSVAGYLGAPSCAMFMLAVFWTRCNEQGAFWGTVIAQIWGLSRFVLDFVYPVPSCGKVDTRPSFMLNFSEYYHMVSEILLAAIVAVVISLLTKPIPKEKLAGFTFWLRNEKPLRDIAAEEAIKKRHLSLDIKASQEMNNKLTNGEPLTSVPKKVNLVKDDEETDCMQTFKSRLLQTLIGDDKVKKTEEQAMEEEEADQQAESYETRMAILKQSKAWRIFLNINAMFVLTLTIFLYSIFA